IDEEQDHSYKQDHAPHYHARVVAEQFARLHGAPLVLGSATPSLESYHRALNGELELLRLSRRIDDRPLPTVECVDMRSELKARNRSVLSRALLDLLKETLERGEQAILLLNRRGYSTFVMCRACGLVVKCPECSLPLVYHDDGRLRCHRCEIECAPPKVCPACGSRYIKYFGSGTQKLEEVLKAELPTARILRMDRDTTTRRFSHQRILDQFRAHEADILFGTQMVAKGHDIAGVTAAGILSADASLNMPDFRSSETCFMLITQAAGRAGRSDRAGRVIVQAYNVEHAAVVFGCRQDYEGFFESELPKREELFYPPFSRLIKLLIVGRDKALTKSRAAEIAEQFRAEFARSEERSEIMGPTSAMISCWKGVHRFVLLIKTTELDRVRGFLRSHALHQRDDITIDIDPIMIL
ncbi:MAG: primosomal protein N', partial [Selenomonadaceae bacterium]|nr:primosomal protein N' [Selenomonadaceae bacterium]